MTKNNPSIQMVSDSSPASFSIYTNPKENEKSRSPVSSKTSTVERKQLAYIKRYAKVAQQEMKKFGIPASIKLAQGLLESQAGQSPLVQKNNNHFGIKCFSKSCQKGHCSNFEDDFHKDFFQKYANSWESYRAHSLFLSTGKRYQRLFRLSPNDYQQWAWGLQKAGYATDKQYANKLLELIERYELTTYDEM